MFHQVRSGFGFIHFFFSESILWRILWQCHLFFVVVVLYGLGFFVCSLFFIKITNLLFEIVLFFCFVDYSTNITFSSSFLIIKQQKQKRLKRRKKNRELCRKNTNFHLFSLLVLKNKSLVTIKKHEKCVSQRLWLSSGIPKQDEMTTTTTTIYEKIT